MEKKKTEGEKKMHKLLHIRTSDQFAEVLGELAWAKRQSKTAIVKLAVLKFFEENEDNIMKESRDKIRKLLEEAPEFQSKGEE